MGDDPRLRRPDISKARALLGWQPHTPLETGLREVIRELRVVLNGEVPAPRRAASDPMRVTPPSVAPARLHRRASLRSGPEDPATR